MPASEWPSQIRGVIAEILCTHVATPATSSKSYALFQLFGSPVHLAALLRTLLRSPRGRKEARDVRRLILLAEAALLFASFPSGNLLKR